MYESIHAYPALIPLVEENQNHIRRDVVDDESIRYNSTVHIQNIGRNFIMGIPVNYAQADFANDVTEVTVIDICK